MAEDKVVLPSGFGAGPKGVGDPDDTRLRKVELTIKIPQIMRDRAKKEKCIEEVEKFSTCCKSSGLLMTFKCKSESDQLKKCMEKWYQDPMFKDECTKQYLEQRRLYRLQGDKKPMKAKESEMF